jgi:type III secretion system YscD/HrpQ family protein
LQSARQVFELYKVRLQAAIGPGGRLEVRGALDDSRRVEEILAALKQDVSGIASLENRVHTSADLHAFFSRELARSGLLSKVRLEMDNGGVQAILLKGKVDSADAARWKQVKSAAARELRLEIGESWTDQPSPILLKNTAAFLELDQGLMSVNVGEVNRITLRNGKKFLEGSRLRSGRVIKSIRQDRIVLEKDGREEIYYLKGGP